MLRTEEDFVILDFEGEPARSVAERRAKYSPLKDVAGMVRSYSYAAYAALFAFTLHAPDDFALLETWADTWQRCAADAFLAGYRATAGGATTSRGPLLPAGEGFDRLLSAFVLEKATYELAYELNNRPDWVRIPLAGIAEQVRMATGLHYPFRLTTRATSCVGFHDTVCAASRPVRMDVHGQADPRDPTAPSPRQTVQLRPPSRGARAPAASPGGLKRKPAAAPAAGTNVRLPIEDRRQSGPPLDASEPAKRSESMASSPSEEDIRLRAYQRYLERGGGHGMDFEDWLEAERELKKAKSKKAKETKSKGEGCICLEHSGKARSRSGS